MFIFLYSLFLYRNNKNIYNFSFEGGIDMSENFKGYKEVLWCNVNEGDEVFIKGTHLSNFRAYGPHYVHSKEKRQLKNFRNDVFPEPMENLLVRVDND